MKKVKLLALLAAIVTALLLFVFLSSVIKFGGADTTKVVTAAQDIPANTVITEQMLAVSDVPTDNVLAGAITKVSDVVGKTIQSNIYVGEQIISAKLIAAGENTTTTLAYAIKPGKRAITIAVDATTGIAGMITPGNKIDLVGEYETNGTVYTAMVAEDIKVLAVDAVLSESGKAGDGTTPGYTTLTLEVTQKQAMELSMATYSGTLRAILRSPVDNKMNKPKSITLKSVLAVK